MNTVERVLVQQLQHRSNSSGSMSDKMNSQRSNSSSESARPTKLTFNVSTFEQQAKLIPENKDLNDDTDQDDIHIVFEKN